MTRNPARHRPDAEQLPPTRRARRVAAVLLAVGLAGLTFGVQYAYNANRLTASELGEVRSLLEDRRAVRDAEQGQRDQVMCTVLAVLAQRATAQQRPTLVRAANDLGCGALPAAGTTTPPTTSKPRRTPTVSPSPRDTDDSKTSGSAGTPRPAGTLVPQPSASPKPTPRPTAPRPTPTPQPTGLLDPVADPICQLLDVCL